MAATHALFDWEFSEVENQPDDAIDEVIDHRNLSSRICQIKSEKPFNGRG